MAAPIVIWGSNWCRRPHCKTWMCIRTDITFTSTVTGEKFYAHITTSCKTSNILCLFEYINLFLKTIHGEIRELPTYTNERSQVWLPSFIDSLTNLSWNVFIHLATCSKSFVMIIGWMCLMNCAQWKCRETYWIYNFQMPTPHSLNQLRPKP